MKDAKEYGNNESKKLDDEALEAASGGTNPAGVMPVILSAGVSLVLLPGIPVPTVPIDGVNQKEARQAPGDADELGEPLKQR